MKILVDTNILLSAMWFQNSNAAKALLHVSANHELVLCDLNIKEMREVIRRKTPDILDDLEIFLTELSYKLIRSTKESSVKIRDPKDQPILNAAIECGVDIILTGDKDFLSLELASPKPMTIAQFLKAEGF